MADKNVEVKRNVDEIMEELFKGRDAALEKYARVRITQYEINLWRDCGLPLSEVAGSAKQYFSKRFLNGERIATASDETLRAGIDSLKKAVEHGCKGRCTRLAKELNEAMIALGLEPVKDIDKMLDWLTFSYEVKTDYEGNPVVEKPYGFEIRIFHSDGNRKAFWSEAQALLKEKKMISLTDILRIVQLKKKAKSIG